MGKPRSTRFFVCDFETTVYPGQKMTEVWATACVELFTEDVDIYNSIWDFYEYIVSLEDNATLYFHNLKFDGAFVIDYLLRVLEYKQAYIPHEGFQKFKDMPNKSFRYSISAMGQWYTITIKINDKKIEIRDSLKLIPFSVKEIGETFGTKHKKLDMDYEGYRFAGCEITNKEKEYIRNDVLVVKEALEIMIRDGHDKLTIGSCCLSEFKRGFDKKDYEDFFPNLYKVNLKRDRWTQGTIGDWIHASYRGGWCYVVRGKEGKVHRFGSTADVNSLYPSVMHSMSGNYFPVGFPTLWNGNYIPEEATINHRYYFVRIKTRFKIKDGFLPFIQIKRNKLYKSTECLTTSDVCFDGKYYSKYKDKEGNVQDTRVTLTLTMTDFELIKRHYDLFDFEIIGGMWFRTEIGLFDKYIDKYKKIKMESKGAVRQEAKLFLNNLYGKLASSTDSSYKIVYIKEDGSTGFKLVEEYDKTPGYIPCGSAITSYARAFTITAAQDNYYGPNNPGFAYADTDSIHCDLKPEELKGIKIHKTEFCHWSLESQWDEAIFERQKTYIEHITHDGFDKLEKPYYDIKCAGMPNKPKMLFNMSMTMSKEEVENMSPEKIAELKLNEMDLEFIKTKRTIRDFTRGLNVPGKLTPVRMKGGIVLMEKNYEMR